MDNDGEMESTIKKIKLHEHDKENKLKEKRAFEATLTTLKRNLHETMMATRKLKEEYVEATAKANASKAEVITAQTLRSSLAAQLQASEKQLQQLKIESELGISKVWELRNELCNEVHKVSEQCDVWALFTKPKYIEPAIKSKKLPNENANQVNSQTGLLESAQRRRQSLIGERNRLVNEPDFGEEFKRKCLTYQTGHRLVSSNVQENENSPIKFSTSPAAQKTVAPVMRKVKVDMPWYQPYCVVTSVAVFLIYFCILREENDMDLEFDKSLYERIHGLEKEQLLLSYRYNKEIGKSVEDIEKRLKEIEAEETMVK